MNFNFIKSKFTFAYIRLLNVRHFYFSRLLKSGYQIFIPASTYAPWHLDSEFNKTFNGVKSNSLINYYLAWDLWKLAEQSDKIEGDIIEVGVWRGSSTILMAKKMELIGSTKQILSCDTFEGVVKADTSLEMVRNFIENKFNLKNVTLIKGIFPDDALDNPIIDRKYALCHIDVDTYESCRGVVDWIWDKLSIGGIIVFNDYGFPNTKGVTDYVNSFRSDPSKIVIHNLNGHGIIIKIK